MVHKRYIVRNGKRYGPYFYESYRTKGGKVKNKYIGKKKSFTLPKLLQKLFFIFATVAVLILTINDSASFQSTLSGETNLTIWDDTDTLTKKSNDQVYFYANYTNDTSGGPITLAESACNITFNLTDSWEQPEINMTFNEATNQYEYNTTFTTRGDLDYNITCQNESFAYLSITDTFTITNTLPTIDIPLTVDNCTEDIICSYNFSANTTDPDANDILTYGYDAASGIFSGFSIDSSTGIVTVNVTVEGQTNDTESVRLTVVDPSGDGAVATKNFTMIFVNDTPIMSVPSNPKECSEDFECSMEITATDEENDTYSFLTNNTLFPINSETGLVNVTITNNDVGDYMVNISVNDTYGNTASTDVNISVNNTNDIPSLDYICNDTIEATEDVSYECEINATDPDMIHGDNLTFVANESWFEMESNGSNATVNITANDSWVGSWFINVSVVDADNVSDSRVINVTITNVSDAPSLTAIGEQSAFTGTFFYYDINATDEDLNIPGTTETLTFSLEDLNSSNMLSLNESTGEISFAPTSDHLGEKWFNFSVNDTDGTTSSELVNITVYNNTRPTLTMDTEFNYTEDQRFDYNLSLNATDAEGDQLTFTINHSLFDINSTTGEINITLNDSFVGENWINITVADTHDVSVSLDLNVTVYNVEDKPNFTEVLGEYAAFEDSQFYLQVNQSDEDLYIPAGNIFGIAENLTFSADSPGLLTISSDGIINITPNNTQIAEWWVNISVIDYTNKSYSETINITVFEVNDWPSFTDIENISGIQDTPVYIDINASDEEDGLDSDGNNTNFTFWVNTTEFDPDENTSIINGTTGIISFTPNSSHVGTHRINLTVNESLDASTSMEFIMTINATNNSPTVTSCTVSGFSCGAPCSCDQPFVYENTTNTTFTIYLEELDDEELTYEWYIDGVLNLTGSGTDTGVGTGSGNIGYAPGFFDLGYHNLSVFINDSSNITAVEWNISVLNTNSPPTSDAQMPNISWNQDTEYTSFDLDAYFTDLENQSDLLFNWTHYDDGLNEIGDASSNINISVSAAHGAIFTPSLGWHGFEYAIFHANDTEDNVSSNIISLNVSQTTPAASILSGAGGGGKGGGGGGIGKEELITVDMIHASEFSFIEDQQIISPVKIRNTNTKITLHNINLSAESKSEFIVAQLDRTFIDQLAPGEERTVNLLMKGTRAGIGEIDITANVLKPPFKDSAKFFINVVPLNITSMEEKVRFVKDLFKEHPECLELNEVVTRAEKAIKNKKYEEASSLIQLAIEKCKDLIASKVERKPAIVIKGWSAKRILLITLNLATAIFTIYIIRKVWHKRRQKAEYD